MRKSCIPFILLSLIMISSPSQNSAFCQDSDSDIEILSSQIIEKRATLESLYDQLSYLKKDYESRTSSLIVQRSELEAQLQQEELRRRRLQNELSVFSSEETGIAEDEEIRNFISVLLKKTSEYILSGIPFHTENRLDEIRQLEASLETGEMGPGAVLSSLWNFLEAEFVLTGESGMYTQTIQLNGQNVLADVARLGTVFLYFRTYDGKYGYAVQEGEGWIFLPSSNREESRHISTLFDLLEKNIHQGFIVLPNPYAVR